MAGMDASVVSPIANKSVAQVLAPGGKSEITGWPGIGSRAPGSCFMRDQRKTILTVLFDRLQSDGGVQPALAGA